MPGDFNPWNLSADHDPMVVFGHWLTLAKRNAGKDEDPTACALATVDAGGHPQVRMVLIKSTDLTFFTNKNSRKAEQIKGNTHISLCFHWPKPHRQLRLSGYCQSLDDQANESYFASRDRESQIGAWASHQSQTLNKPETLAEQCRYYALKFASGPIPRPQYWGGFCLDPVEIEFWQSRPARLHERALFQRQKSSASWSFCLLNP